MKVKEHKRGNIKQNATKQKYKCVMKRENGARIGPLEHCGNDTGQL